MQDIYVVTHPEATHHVDDLVGGQYDSELTERGLADAQRIADALAARFAEAGDPGHPGDVAVFTSDLRRCATTADAIATRLGVAATLVPALREKSYGEGEGRPDAWFRERFVPPPEHGERLHHDEGLAGGETKAAWAARVYDGTDVVLADPATRKVVVTHGGSATYVVTRWIGMPLDTLSHVSFRFTSGGITHLQQDDYFHNRRVVSLDETGHLDG